MDKEPGLAYLVTPAAEVKKPDRGAKTHWHLTVLWRGRVGFSSETLTCREKGISVTMEAILQLQCPCRNCRADLFGWRNGAKGADGVQVDKDWSEIVEVS